MVPNSVPPGRRAPLATPPAQSGPSASPLARSARPSPGPGPSALRVSAAPVGHNAPGIRPPPPGKPRPGARPAPHAAARRPGAPGVSRGPRSCDTRSWSGPRHRSAMPAGPRAMTSRNASRGKRRRPPCGRSPFHGTIAFLGVGKSVPCPMRAPLSRPSLVVAHRCSTIWPRQPEPS